MRVYVLMSAAVMASLAAMPVYAQNATWLRPAPRSGDFNTPTNWTPATVPTGTASFGTSNNTALSFSAPTTRIGGWTFNAGAPAYTFINIQPLTFTGAGIDVNGGSATITNNARPASCRFFNSSTAGSATINNTPAACISATPARPAALPSPMPAL